ncbi:MAG: Fe-S cluster assembly protein SufD [Verrucomicrobiota bacterium]|jgi:Fe-S cluster assembly protein SufD
MQTFKDMPAQSPAAVDALAAALGDFASVQPGANPPWLKSIREAARTGLGRIGFPNTRQEEWRFTSMAPLLQLPLHPAAPNGRHVTARDIAPFRLEGMGHCLVFVDGWFREDLSALPGRAGAVQMGGLRAQLAGNPRELEQDLARHAGCGENFFTALNTAFFQDGAFISAPAGATVEEPVQLLFLAASERPGATVHSRALILAGKGSGLKIVESYASLTDTPHLTNAVTELVLGAEARVEHCRLQNENGRAFHVSTVQAVQGRGSHWISHSIATGARLARNQVQTLLDAEGAEAVLNGLYLGRDEQLIDHHTVVDHAKPHCESHEFFHGILTDRSHGVFNGKIFVRQDAQKTNAKQTNRNLVLSDNATIDTKPQLEIFADDVKCTHGATIGQLNDEALFYLRSRGIGAAQARRMLIRAFANDVVERITIAPAREQLDQLLAGRFESAAI